ncbi:flavin-containing monooxygenase [Thermostaphylospora chromogena]|uniref:Putative flavoprotein involved in K+ transport n=1 Tax=Thermostaphylospora chromogena TaxID=35622 RepID=A0A1H1D9V8_9ACTN|nr:NAD(P)/FAD-dependent oxidoreductase [Thermostaphylospora chromogena]SDQ73214.1 putative flavoprotein involved in K+ transport [Thermostaphylospora chromogena]
MSSRSERVVIIGAGQAGLATAYTARRAGLAPLVLEASDRTVGSWPYYYDSLTLFSPARRSSLPGRAFPGDPDGYPVRDEVVAYLTEYAAHLDVDIRTGHRVEKVIAADANRLEVVTADGETFIAPMVIAATGAFSRPHRPALPGLDSFPGTVLHSADYRRPEPLAGKRVVIVGGGNSAVQIAVELADHTRVTLATRYPLRFIPQKVLGRDVHLWLAWTGLDTAGWAKPLLTGDKGTPVMDSGGYRDRIATGNPDRRPMFIRLDGDHVIWSDGTRERVDVVLLATGYRPGVDYLADLNGALDDTGRPRHRGGVSPAHPGLGFVGLEWQRSFSSATLRGVGPDARHVLNHLLRRRTRAWHAPART